MAREPEMLAWLEEIAALARAMHRALLAEDLDAVGELIGQHCEVNKRMDPGCTNPFIDELFALCRPYWVGAKLAGPAVGGSPSPSPSTPPPRMPCGASCSSVTRMAK